LRSILKVFQTVQLWRSNPAKFAHEVISLEDNFLKVVAKRLFSAGEIDAIVIASAPQFDWSSNSA